MEKIGIFGPAVEISTLEQSLQTKAVELGQELGKHDITLITGACTGVPYLVAREVARQGREVWGFSAFTGIEGQMADTPTDDLSVYSKIFYVPEDYDRLFVPDSLDDFTRQAALYKYRNVISTAACDGGIVVAGRWGTTNEFTNLHDMGRIIGVLTGTGGIADELPVLYPKISKVTKAVMLFSYSAQELVQQVMGELEQRSQQRTE